MFIGEPQRTPYDLNFSIGDVPVRVHPLFWLVAVLLGGSGIGPNDNAVILLLVWVGIMFFSILIHELGHVLAMRYYGISAHVVLYAMGGLAISGRGYGGYGDRGNRSLSQIVISLAGPGAGFLFAGLVVAILCAFNRWVPFYFPGLGAFRLGMGEPLGSGGNVSPILVIAIFDILWINIGWGLFNLLPVYPLDGGQVCREVCLLNNSRNGVRTSLQISMIVAICLAAWGLSVKSYFIAIMFGLLAYQSYQLMQMTGRYGGGRPW